MVNFFVKRSINQAVLQMRGIYVRSKLWIFDDRHAIVGSANCDERGYSHESEFVLGVTEDDRFPETRLGFAHKLRMAFWSKHSLAPFEKLIDWQASLPVWDHPATDSMIQPYDAFSDLGPSDNWSGTFLYRRLSPIRHRSARRLARVPRLRAIQEEESNSRMSLASFTTEGGA